MARLPSTAEMSELIGRVYDASLDGGRWKDLLKSLAVRFGAHQALLAEITPDGSAPDRLYSHEIDMNLLRRWQGSRDHVDLWLQRLPDYPAGHAYLSTELVPLSKLKKSAHYADILRPSDIEYSLGGILESGPRRHSFFGVFRGADAGDFSNAQKELIRILIPHVRRALRINSALAEAERAHAELWDFIENCAFGVIVLDGKGAVLALNSRARRMVSAQDGLAIRHARVRLWNSFCQRCFDVAVASATLSGVSVETSGFSVLRPSSRKPYRCIVAPLGPRSRQAPRSLARDRCVVFVRDVESDRHVSSEVWAQLYRLTPAEERLCAALVETGALPAAVEALHVTRNTAKSQLKSIFQKVGVSSQGELLRELAFVVSMRRA